MGIALWAAANLTSGLHIDLRTDLPLDGPSDRHSATRPSVPSSVSSSVLSFLRALPQRPAVSWWGRLLTGTTGTASSREQPGNDSQPYGAADSEARGGTSDAAGNKTSNPSHPTGPGVASHPSGRRPGYPAAGVGKLWGGPKRATPAGGRTGLPADTGAGRPLRVMRLVEEGRGARCGSGRLAISGRMADVCAELERLAAQEAAQH